MGLRLPYQLDHNTGSVGGWRSALHHSMKLSTSHVCVQPNPMGDEHYQLKQLEEAATIPRDRRGHVSTPGPRPRAERGPGSGALAKVRPVADIAPPRAWHGCLRATAVWRRILKRRRPNTCPRPCNIRRDWGPRHHLIEHKWLRMCLLLNCCCWLARQ